MEVFLHPIADSATAVVLELFDRRAAQKMRREWHIPARSTDRDNVYSRFVVSGEDEKYSKSLNEVSSDSDHMTVKNLSTQRRILRLNKKRFSMIYVALSTTQKLRFMNDYTTSKVLSPLKSLQAYYYSRRVA